MEILLEHTAKLSFIFFWEKNSMKTNNSLKFHYILTTVARDGLMSKQNTNLYRLPINVI